MDFFLVALEDWCKIRGLKMSELDHVEVSLALTMWTNAVHSCLNACDEVNAICMCDTCKPNHETEEERLALVKNYIKCYEDGIVPEPDLDDA